MVHTEDDLGFRINVHWRGLVIRMDGAIYVIGESPKGLGVLDEVPGGVTTVESRVSPPLPG